MRRGKSGVARGGSLLVGLIAAGCAGRATQGGTSSEGGKGAAPVEAAGTTSAGEDSANGTAGLVQPSSGGAAGDTAAATGGFNAETSAGSSGEAIAGSGGTISDSGGAGGFFSAGGNNNCGGSDFGLGGLGQCLTEPPPPPSGPGGATMLTPVNGWVDGASNSALIQGAVYADADPLSKLKMSSDFAGSNMCFKGATTIVDPQCTPIPPYDCWMSYWGAGIYLNLNQVIDPTTMMASSPAAYDGSKLLGFSFDLSGPTIPPTSSVRFQVDAAAPDNTYCLQYAYKAGANTALLKELQNWNAGPPCQPSSASNASKAVYQASSLVRLKWTIVPNSGHEVPYDFCISNVRALYK
jgi:hypothetical protein